MKVTDLNLPLFLGSDELVPESIPLNLFGEQFSVYSKSAHYTYFVLKKKKIAFDLGFCPMEAVPCKHVFLSHAHDDHSWGVLRHIQYRNLFGLPSAIYYLPAEVAEDLKEVIHAWFRFKGKPERMGPEVVGIKPNQTVNIQKDFRIESFMAHHSVPSLGFNLFRNRESSEIPFLSYLGDHSVETLVLQPEHGKSKILAIELTFLLEEELGKARTYAHMHLNDLIQLVEQDYFQNEVLILKHVSSRYQKRQVEGILRGVLPEKILKKLIVI